MSIHPHSPTREAREALGGRLRELRKDAGLTARALAEALGQHFTRISKIENGVQAPSAADIRAWANACRAEGEIPDLLASASALESAYVEFRRQGRAGMKRVLGAHTPTRYESTSMFRIYEHNVIPGLFQTAEYAAAMLSFWIAFLETPNDLEQAVAIRMERQRVLYRGDKRFAVVIEEQALRTWFGNAHVQAGQLDRLLALMSLPTVAIGIIPLMRERGGVPSSGFWIFDGSLVALETPSASIEVTRPQEVQLYARMFDNLVGQAQHGDAARRLIRDVAQEVAAQHDP